MLHKIVFAWKTFPCIEPGRTKRNFALASKKFNTLDDYFSPTINIFTYYSLIQHESQK